MTKGYWQPPVADGTESKLNEAWKKLIRLDHEQAKINMCNSNLLAFNLDLHKYNYELKFSGLNTLVAEIYALLKKNEKEKILEKRKSIKEIMNDDKLQVFVTKENLVTHGKEQIVNKKVWNKLEEELFEYELEIKELMKAHNLDLPEDDDPSKAAYR